jgi:hypothetical protein
MVRWYMGVQEVSTRRQKVPKTAALVPERSVVGYSPTGRLQKLTSDTLVKQWSSYKSGNSGLVSFRSSTDGRTTQH